MKSYCSLLATQPAGQWLRTHSCIGFKIVAESSKWSVEAEEIALRGREVVVPLKSPNSNIGVEINPVEASVYTWKHLFTAKLGLIRTLL